MYTESINWTKIKRVFTTRSNLCCIGQGLPGSLPWGVILTYLNDYLVQEQRLNESIAATVRPHAASSLLPSLPACDVMH